MSDDDAGSITVYFACPTCTAPYRATQVRRHESASGQIDCVRCGRPVHRWSGTYDFIRWRPEVRPNRSQ